MRSLLPIAGWVLAALLLGFLVTRQVKVAQLENRVESLMESADSLTAEGVRVTGQRDEIPGLRARLGEAQSEVIHLKARLEQARSKEDAVQTPANASEEAPLVDEGPPQAVAAATKPDIGRAILDALRSDRSGETAERFAHSAVQMNYGEFLEGLDLDPEVLEMVRAALLEVMMDMSVHGVRGPGDVSRERLSEEEYDQLLHDQLSGLLSPEDLWLFDEYQETLEERGLLRNCMFQMDLYGHGLSEENRVLIADVLVEEQLAMLAAQRASARALTPEEKSDALLDLYDRALEWLWHTMDEEQYAILERFIRQVINQDALIQQARESVNESQ